MKRTDALKHVRSTVLARSRGRRTDEAAYHSQPIVLLDVATLWEHPRNGGLARSRQTKTRSGSYFHATVGWLALTLEDGQDAGRIVEFLRYAKTVDLDAMPDRADLPKDVRFDLVMPHEVRYTWEERQEARQAELRQQAERNERYNRRELENNATRAYLAKVTTLLKVTGQEFVPVGTPSEIPFSASRLLHVLERLARAEGVDLPPRPEHLRDR